MSGLLEGWDWFDNGLQNVLAARGLPYLNKTQSMMMMYISAGVERPIEIARRMRLSRQAIRHVSGQLAAIGLIDIVDVEEDKRGRRLAFREESALILNAAIDIIHDLERELYSRIGSDNAQSLRRILQLDWGPVVSEKA